MRTASLLLTILSAAPALAAPASPWQGNSRAQVRLMADADLRAGAYHAGVEIRLGPKTITYWREPGEAGVPPQFDFAASTNVASAQVLYPAPRRIAEAGGVEAFGYENAVIFPVLVTPADPALPVHLALSLTYAACDRICVPGAAEASLELKPGEAAVPDPALARAETEVPHQAGPDKVSVVADAAGLKSGWTVKLAAGLPGMRDVFAEAPDGWYFTTRPGVRPGEFALQLTDTPKDAAVTEVPVVLTLAGEAGSFEMRTLLKVIVKQGAAP